MTAAPARLAALRVLTAVRSRNAYAHETLTSVLAKSGLDERDVAFATRLAYGTISATGTLDESLDHVSDAPLKLEPKVRDALRLAAWEILFGGTESRVAVHEGVEIVKSIRPQAAGIANAVLRRLSSAAQDFPWGDPARDVSALARYRAHPDWLVALLIENLGAPTTAAMLEADNEPAPLYLAANLSLTSPVALSEELEADGAQPEACPLEGCFRAGSPSRALRSAAVAEGRALIADAGAQLAAMLVPVAPRTRLLEVGAGRGTKTALIQSRAISSGGAATILAADVHAYRTELLTDRMRSLSIPNIEALTVDASDAAALAGAVGAPVRVAFIDAPCSGLGTLRRHPEARWRLAPSAIEELALLGERLLHSAARLVEPDGFVVYSTCSVAHRENRVVIERFLATEEGRHFAVDSVARDVLESWQEWVTGEGYFQSVPTHEGPDGHFAARLRRV